MNRRLRGHRQRLRRLGACGLGAGWHTFSGAARALVCRLRLAPRVVTAEHSHPHEQITLVEKGRVLFTNSEPGAADAAFVKVNDPISVCKLDGTIQKTIVTKLFMFDGFAM